tara:strand:+ start:3992 stop:4423 length:432 start_codon:yes stop_codon:yes gene_type:complete
MPLPETSTVFKNITRSEDERGQILSIVDCDIKNVSIITCNKGSIRSNHYHHEDFHFMYVLKGSLNYFFKSIENGELSFLKVKKGQTIFTPAREWHATHFPEQTQLIVSSKNERDAQTYERDTVREIIITEKNVKNYLEICADG